MFLVPRERKKHPIKKGYHHFTQEEKDQIYALKTQGVTQKKIAESISKSPNCICKDLKKIKNSEWIVISKLMTKTTYRKSHTFNKDERGHKSTCVEVFNPIQISIYLEKKTIFISHEPFKNLMILNVKSKICRRRKNMTSDRQNPNPSWTHFTFFCKMSKKMCNPKDF